VLGKHVATYDGSKDDQAGLHFSWPWPIVNVERIDRRLQYFDLPVTELLTHDTDQKTIDKNLLVEAFVVWKIPEKDQVDAFVRRIGSKKKAEEILGKRINSQIGAEIGKRRMDDFVSTDPGRVDDTILSLRENLLKNLQGQVESEYGIHLEDIRLKRFSHPGSVREFIFQRIRSERQKKAGEYLSEGNKKARDIEAEAEQKSREMIAQARLEEARIKSEADTKALALRNDAQSADPEFYSFLKRLEKLQNILSDNKTILLLSTHRPMFDLLFNPPTLQKKETPKTEEKKQ